MKDKGHYLKPGVRVTAPGVLFSVVIDPRIETGARDERNTFHTWGGAAVAVSKWRRGKWGKTEHSRCETPAALAKWMQDHADPKSRNYVVSPSAGESLAMGRVWDVIDAGPVKYQPAGIINPPVKAHKRHPDLTVIRRVVLSPRVCILDYARAGVRWIWLSGRQFFASTEDELSKTLQVPWADTGRKDKPNGRTVRTARERALLWLAAFQELSSMWRQNARAPFGLTASACSMGILRTHVQPRTLCTHTDPDAHRLERDACFGGRASVWYYGDVGTPARYSTAICPAPLPSEYGRMPGPLTNLDVRSMYPWLLREHSFPCKKVGYSENAMPSEPAAVAASFGVIARVTIETDVPEYPLRCADGIIYPVGRFTTTLTGPELLRLRGEGRVVKCHAMSTYTMGRPFREAAAALIRLRESARAEGKPAWELFAKLLGNGLGGKLAQAKGQWDERPRVTPALRFGEWFDVSADGTARHRYRAIAGLVWEYAPDKSGAGPHTPAFAYLTALGRLHMRRLRDECPARSVVQMDTDGLWVRTSAVSALRRAGEVGGEHAGCLRVSMRATAARFLDAKHYFTPGRWVLSGFANPAVGYDARWVSDEARNTPVAGPAGAPPRGVSVIARTSALGVKVKGLRIEPDGWATPKAKR